MDYNTTLLLCCSNCHSVGFWEPSLSCPLCPSDIPYHCRFLVFVIFIFVCVSLLSDMRLQDALGSSCMFPPPILQSDISPKKFWLLILENDTRNQVLMLSALVAFGMFLLCFLANRTNKYKCIYTSPCIHIYTQTFLYVTIYIYIKLNVSSQLCFQVEHITTWIILALPLAYL